MWVTVAIVLWVLLMILFSKRKAEAMVDPLVSQLRLIAQEPVPKRDDPRFKEWKDIGARFPAASRRAGWVSRGRFVASQTHHGSRRLVLAPGRQAVRIGLGQATQRCEEEMRSGEWVRSKMPQVIRILKNYDFLKEPQMAFDAFISPGCPSWI